MIESEARAHQAQAGVRNPSRDDQTRRAFVALWSVMGDQVRWPVFASTPSLGWSVALSRPHAVVFRWALADNQRTISD